MTETLFSLLSGTAELEPNGVLILKSSLSKEA